ncbi:hypothetical protein [Sporosarcina sp. NPDC096371]|uniref:hypothetical protein n=1 Tax=Sporosarcina sp. NPDC096371 TaxID=3364530 RepID=UPI003813DFB7
MSKKNSHVVSVRFDDATKKKLNTIQEMIQEKLLIKVSHADIFNSAVSLQYIAMQEMETDIMKDALLQGLNKKES